MKAEAKREAPVPQLELESFLPYQLSVLSNIVSGKIARSYEKQFGLSIPEWRVMAVLGRFSGLTAADVTARTAMDKVQVSRAVARLQAAGRIEQQTVDGDRRARHLFLTLKGLEDYNAIVPLARDYERRLAGSLSAVERSQLDALLDKLSAAAAAL